MRDECYTEPSTLKPNTGIGAALIILPRRPARWMHLVAGVHDAELARTGATLYLGGERQHEGWV